MGYQESNPELSAPITPEDSGDVLSMGENYGVENVVDLDARRAESREFDPAEAIAEIGGMAKNISSIRDGQRDVRQLPYQGHGRAA